MYSVAYSYFKAGIDIQDKKNYLQGDTVTCTKTFYPFTAKKKEKKRKKKEKKRKKKEKKRKKADHL